MHISTICVLIIPIIYTVFIGMQLVVPAQMACFCFVVEETLLGRYDILPCNICFRFILQLFANFQGKQDTLLLLVGSS